MEIRRYSVVLGTITLYPLHISCKLVAEASWIEGNISFTQKEFDLLSFLLARMGRTVSVRDILHEVWNYPEGVVTRTHTTHIGRLRKLLEPDPTNPQLILSVRGVGYKIV